MLRHSQSDTQNPNVIDWTDTHAAGDNATFFADAIADLSEHDGLGLIGLVGQQRPAGRRAAARAEHPALGPAPEPVVARLPAASAAGRSARSRCTAAPATSPSPPTTRSRRPRSSTTATPSSTRTSRCWRCAWTPRRPSASPPARPSTRTSSACATTCSRRSASGRRSCGRAAPRTRSSRASRTTRRALVEYCFEEIQLDLTPGANDRNCAPEHLWNGARWWSEAFGEFDRPITGRCRDPRPALRGARPGRAELMEVIRRQPGHQARARGVVHRRRLHRRDLARPAREAAERALHARRAHRLARAPVRPDDPRDRGRRALPGRAASRSSRCAPATPCASTPTRSTGTAPARRRS